PEKWKPVFRRDHAQIEEERPPSDPVATRRLLAGAMLPFREMFDLLKPPSRYYRRRIEHEAVTGEPELAILGDLMQRGGTAVDVGANQGFFAFALAGFADRIIAFEPNPDYAL